MTQTKPIVSIENVVASASVDQRIDLNVITQTFPDVEYHPDQFPGLVFRLKSPKTATLIFSSGKMVCTGAKSEEQAIKAVRSVVQKLRKGGIKIKKDAVIIIQNMVASASLGGKIHLEQAARSLPRSMYEPEQFPGLIHRMLDPKTVILLFASGKLVCTGAKKESDVYRSVHNLHTLLEEKELMIYESKLYKPLWLQTRLICFLMRLSVCSSSSFASYKIFEIVRTSVNSYNLTLCDANSSRAPSNLFTITNAVVTTILASFRAFMAFSRDRPVVPTSSISSILELSETLPSITLPVP